MFDIKPLVKALVCCSITIVSVILLSHHNILLFLILSLILYIILYLDQEVDPVLVLLSGLIGAATESVIMTMATSSWRYINPDIYNLPVWLIPLWSIASYCIHNLYKLDLSELYNIMLIGYITRAI